MYSIVPLLMLLILSTFPTSSSAADYSRVGIRAGDTAVYLHTFARAGGTVNVTGRVLVKFVNVSGTIVRINETWSPSGGPTSGGWTYDFNVSSGGVIQKHFIPTGVPLYLIAVGLGVGDPIYERWTYRNITEIILMKVTWATRWVNHYHRSLSWMEMSDVEDYYWDRETGLLVQRAFRWNYTDGSWYSAGTENDTLIFASVFAPRTSELFLAAGAVTAAVATLVAAFAMSKRHRTR